MEFIIWRFIVLTNSYRSQYVLCAIHKKCAKVDYSIKFTERSSSSRSVQLCFVSESHTDFGIEQGILLPIFFYVIVREIKSEYKVWRMVALVRSNMFESTSKRNLRNWSTLRHTIKKINVPECTNNKVYLIR